MCSRVVSVGDYHSPLFNQLSCYRGETLIVDWAKSTQSWLWCKRNVAPDAPEAQEGLVPAELLRETWEEQSAALGVSIISREMENDVLKYTDPVLKQSSSPENATASHEQTNVSSLFGGSSGTTSGTSSLFGQSSATSASSTSTSSLFSGSFSLAAAIEASANQAPILTPGLANFIWPMHPAEFMAKIWQKKAYVVQGCGERLPKMKEDFMNYDVEQLVANASDCVVWMKTTDGKIQHLYADNKTAYHCYLAGHSLYFNPPMELQKAYIKQLAEDLGANFGIKKDDGFGGDIEIFAVRGKNVTDWHFDAQENFTIQLVGCKRWSITPGVACPITNHTNPKNIATQKYDEHRKVHASYAPAADVEPPKDFSQAQTFVLRPGSVMYVPGGYWHHVTCDSDEGSLSLNFSISTTTWMELLMNSLSQHLWKYRHWRENIIVKDPSSARAHMTKLLQNLPKEIAQLTAHDLLPKGLFREFKEREVNTDTSEQGNNTEIAKDTVLRRNPVAVIIKDRPTTAAVSIGHKSATTRKGDRKRSLQSISNQKEKMHARDEGESSERDGKESWSLHVGFGNNKDFRSNLEVKLFVKRELACIIDWIERRNGAPSTDEAEPGGRWAPFTANQLYIESGYRQWAKARKEEYEQRRKRRRREAEARSGVDQNKESSSHEAVARLRMMMDGDDADDMGELEDDYGDEFSDGEQEPAASGGFGDLEQLLSILLFNGYLTKVKPTPPTNNQ